MPSVNMPSAVLHRVVPSFSSFPDGGLPVPRTPLPLLAISRSGLLITPLGNLPTTLSWGVGCGVIGGVFRTPHFRTPLPRLAISRSGLQLLTRGNLLELGGYLWESEA
jgi:hypothetical protein